MKYWSNILRRIIFLILFIFLLKTNNLSYGQGSGGPQALPNAFAGGPPPPPGGGGGGGNPIQVVPLDSDMLFLLVISGILYFVYHQRKYWLHRTEETSTLNE